MPPALARTHGLLAAALSQHCRGVDTRHAFRPHVALAYAPRPVVTPPALPLQAVAFPIARLVLLRSTAGARNYQILAERNLPDPPATRPP